MSRAKTTKEIIVEFSALIDAAVKKREFGLDDSEEQAKYKEFENKKWKELKPRKILW
jgi:hypothetical protein